MPLSRITKVFAVTDCKMYPLLTDPAGGTATYGPGIDVPGIKTVRITGTVATKSLRGDNQLLDSDTVLQDVSASITHAKLSLDVGRILTGGTVVDTGTTPSQISTLDVLGSSRPGLFKLSAVSASADVIGGNVSFDLHKCIANTFPELGLAEEDYQPGSFGVSCMPLLANGKWISPAINETARVLT